MPILVKSDDVRSGRKAKGRHGALWRLGSQWVKDQRSANSVRRQLGEQSRKIGKDIHPVYTSRKIGSNIKPKESKPPVVNQQCVVYHFKCDLCDADYVGYTCRHLYQRIEEHKGSTIGKHVRDQHRGGTQVTYLLDSRSYGSARENLTA